MKDKNQLFHKLFVKRSLVGLVLSLIMLTTPSLAYGQSKVAAKPVEPFYREVTESMPEVYEPTVTYLSPEKKAPITFSSLGATWEQQTPQGTSVDLEVRLKNEGQFTNWYHLDPSTDEKYVGISQGFNSFISTNKATAYQYRITLKSSNTSQTPIFENLKFTFISGGSPGEKTDALVASRNLSSSDNFENPPANFDSEAYLAANQDLVKQKRAEALKSDTLANLSALAEPVLVLPPEVRQTIKPVTISTPKVPIRSTTGLKLISRAEWGADESLRLYTDTQTEPELVKFEDDYYTKFADELKENKRIETDENGKRLTWPLSYPESIKKIVIHHTASTNNLDDPKKAIRDIYVWHTLSRGWGDIGYNYIIDQQGNIYEGRYGGEMVVGAHAGKANHGSIGIAILGNYQNEDPPEAVVNSLTALIKEKATLYKIDTEGASLFRGEIFNNVMGHKDVMSTSCPGDKLYTLLPLIRKIAKVQISTVPDKQNPSPIAFSWAKPSAPIISILTSGRKMATITVKNTGTATWGAGTYFKIPNTENSKLLLRNYENILTSTVGKEVKPGDTAEIQVLLLAGRVSGSALIDLQPVINGRAIAQKLQFGLQIKSPPPKLKYDYELKSIILSKNDYRAGETIAVTVKLRNTGMMPWVNSGINKLTLGADNPRDHKNNLLSVPSARLANMVEPLVKSGELATFTFNIKVPREKGVYLEYFSPVVEGIQWLNNRDSYLQINVGTSITPTNTPTPVVSHPTVSNPTPVGSATVNVASKTLAQMGSPRNIRIDIAYRGEPAVISANGQFYLYEGATKKATFAANQLVHVKRTSTGFEVAGDGKIFNLSSNPRFIPATSSVIMRIVNFERRNTWGDKANNNLFRGVLEVLNYQNELHVINELPLEDYIKGIAEESSNEPDEKIKSIMIIARTYARFYMEVGDKFPGAPFDLNDDPNMSQKYLGYAFESRSPKTARLAAETAGRYLTYQGKLIKTPYFSRTDGTKTISAFQKWGWTDTPFLASVDDSFCQSDSFWGHGVGLSGCGAKALALQGKTYEQILKHYYPGTEITKI